MRDLIFEEAASVEEAVGLLAKYGADGKVLAGGTDLVAAMNERETRPKAVVYVADIPELKTVREDEDGLHIGAAVTHTALSRSPLIQAKAPCLAEAALSIGSPPIRNAGTVAGNLATASPAADMAPPLLVLDARVRLRSQRGERVVPLRGFFLGVNKTALEPDELITEVLVPRASLVSSAKFLKLGKRAAQTCTVASAAVSAIFHNGTIKEAWVALGSVAPTPLLAVKASAFLAGKPASEEVIREAGAIAAEETLPITDQRSTAWYRKEVSKVLVARALREAAVRKS